MQSLGEDKLAKSIIKEQQELKSNLWKTSDEAIGIETNETKEWFDADCEIITGKEERNMYCYGQEDLVEQDVPIMNN